MVHAAACSIQVWDRIAPGLVSQFDSPYTIPIIAPRPQLILNGIFTTAVSNDKSFFYLRENDYSFALLKVLSFSVLKNNVYLVI